MSERRHYDRDNPWRRAPPWALQLRNMVGHLIEEMEKLMATKEEVAADIAEIKNEVIETRGAANSAIVLLNQYIDMVTSAAASATDLDAFRADLALIKAETQATEDELKAAVITRNQPPTT